jgi:tungstate transport system substrate-binding protein
MNRLSIPMGRWAMCRYDGRWPDDPMNDDPPLNDSRVKRLLVALLLALSAGCLNPHCDGPPPRHQPALILATTTSVGNSGLLDPLLAAYRESARMDIQPQLVGSGLALKMLADSHADIVISHSPAGEEAALGQHPRWDYRKFMFNDFVVVGPPDDVAKVREAKNLVDAMRRIAGSGARFISRGDQSGTHEREQQLWARAGTTPAGGRLVVAGAAMGSTLRVASESGAYTLTDRATFDQLADSLKLAVVFEGGSLLLNTYAVVVDQDGPRASEAAAFAAWLSDGAGRQVIDSYRGKGKGQPFRSWPAGHARSQPQDSPF